MTQEQMVKAIQEIGNILASQIATQCPKAQISAIVAASPEEAAQANQDAQQHFDQLVKLSMACDEDGTSEEDTRADLQRQFDEQTKPLFNKALSELPEEIPEAFRDNFRNKTISQIAALVRDIEKEPSDA